MKEAPKFNFNDFKIDYKDPLAHDKVSQIIES